MMISKKRLKKLIEQKATIYCIVKEPFIAGYSNILKIVPIVLDNSYGISVEEYNNQNKCKPLFYQKGIIFHNICDADNIYETKEEAEFVQKFHTSKTVYFEPPTWEEFLRTETDELKPNYTFENLVIVEDYNEIIVEDYNNDLNEKHFSYNKELNNRKQKYYETVEYAKKLFMGEEC